MVEPKVLFFIAIAVVFLAALLTASRRLAGLVLLVATSSLIGLIILNSEPPYEGILAQAFIYAQAHMSYVAFGAAVFLLALIFNLRR
jgi:uncharacterized membrane protein (GlpM family)